MTCAMDPILMFVLVVIMKDLIDRCNKILQRLVPWGAHQLRTFLIDD